MDILTYIRFKMSNQESFIEVLPINETNGIYFFRHMGEFHIHSLIGEGKFSQVFRAIPKKTADSENSKIFNCTIKICRKYNLVKNNAISISPRNILFHEVSELHLLQKINSIGSPNLIQMYDWAIDRKTCELRILMEYMPCDMRNYFSNPQHLSALTENSLKKLTRQILLGLNALHKSLIIHFDLKPENILLDPEKNLVKITDFTVSQFITYDLDKEVLTNGGTYPYMPLEGLFDTKKCGFSYDIWSLGIILFELCCRKLPFEGNDAKTLIKNILSVFELDNIQSLTSYLDYCKNGIFIKKGKEKIGNYLKMNTKIVFINDDGCDLISRMLCINPEYRITAEEALKHPWLANLD